MALGTRMQDAAKEQNSEFWFLSIWNF
jgi:hypothetical protein